jgi:putative ABC transport system substrate-binding protein
MLEPLLKATRTVPIVFVRITDPVGAGLVASLSRPGGNATGFTTSDYAVTGKWLELLKEIAPNVKQVALLRDANSYAGIGQWGAAEAFASSLRIELRPVDMSADAEIARSLEAFARDIDGGGMVVTGGRSVPHRKLIVALAARYRLPAVYGQRAFIEAGGLISYGGDTIDQYRRAATYIDRIFNGIKPSDLPVQNPTKYELVINLKTAKTLGLDIPRPLLATADEVID